MQKILTFTVDDLAYDPDEIGAALNEACTGRRQKYRVRGVCQIDDTVYFLLLRLPDGAAREEYHFSSVSDSTEQGMISLLEQRWETGFDTLASVDLGEGSFLILVTQSRQD